MLSRDLAGKWLASAAATSSSQNQGISPHFPCRSILKSLAVHCEPDRKGGAYRRGILGSAKQITQVRAIVERHIQLTPFSGGSTLSLGGGA